MWMGGGGGEVKREMSRGGTYLMGNIVEENERGNISWRKVTVGLCPGGKHVLGK